MLQPPSYVISYVGIPFCDMGRSRETGLDCFGLVRLVYKERLNIDLPMYDVHESDHALVETEILNAQNGGDWVQVMTGYHREFDVCEMSIPVKIAGVWEFPPLHVGVVIGNEWILHAERMTHSRLSRIHDRRMSSRILGYWRHKKLT